jgi:hypothetical protein
VNPLVSTIIPAYNAAGFLRRAVLSVLSQGIEDVEVLIVNDGSTDGTHDIAEELALNDERVWVVDQANAGVSAARNAGIAVARGEWLHFLDADDWMLEGGLARLIGAATSPRIGSACVGACGGSSLFDEDGLAQGWSTGPGVGAMVNEIGITDLLERNRFQPASMVMNRRCFVDMRFDPTISAAEDWDMWLRLAERGHRWSVVREDVAAYRLRRGGASHRFAAMAASVRSVLVNAFERCRRNCTEVVPMSELRRERLEGSLRRAVLQQVTAAALEDATAGCGGAFTILISNWTGEPAELTAKELADAAFWMIPFADGKSPRAWREADPMVLSRYVRAAGMLWTRLAAEGFIGAGAIDQAREELAGLCVGADEIAARLAASCDPRREVTLIGLGVNAPRVARALRARGVHFDARDDAHGAGAAGTGAAAFVEVGGVEVEIVDPASPYNLSALHLVTVTDDTGIVARLPHGLDVLRWSEARRELRANEVRRLSGLWRGGDHGRMGVAA